MARVPSVVVLDTGMAADGVRPRPLDVFVPAQDHWEMPESIATNISIRRPATAPSSRA